MLPAAAALALAACNRARPAAVSEADRALGLRVGLSDSALTAIREIATGALAELRPMDSLGNALPARGVSFALPERQSLPAIARLRRRMGAGYLVFRAEQGFGHGPDSIAVMPGSDQFDALRVRGTSGPNYNITTDSAIALARRWDAEFGLDIVGAGLDWFEARFRRTPTDFLALARLLYRVCPDVVDQGSGTVEGLAGDMRQSNTLYCWWD